MIVRNQDNGASRQDFDERQPNQFRIWMGKCLVCNLPYFSVGSAEGRANILKILAVPCDNSRWRYSCIDSSGRSCQFGGRVIGHAASVHDVSKDSSHYFSPPFTATNSSRFSMFSSRLPSSILAPAPSAGM